MYSNPVMVLCSPRDLNMISQGCKKTARAPIAKKPLNTVYKFRAQEYEVAIAVGFSEVYCVYLSNACFFVSSDLSPLILNIPCCM